MCLLSGTKLQLHIALEIICTLKMCRKPVACPYLTAIYD